MFRSATRWAGLVSAGLLLALPTTVLAVDGVIEINDARARAGQVTPGDNAGYPVVINEPGSYRLTGNLELRTNADVNYGDEFFSALDLDPNTKHDANTRVNARIALASVDDSWSIALIGKNLTDEETRVWNNDVPTTASNSYFGVPERPRSFAIQARYRF